MATLRDYRFTMEQGRLINEFLQFALDIGEMEEMFGNASVPRKVLVDRQNPVEILRPGQFKFMFGMSKQACISIFQLVAGALTRNREGENPTVLPAFHRFLIFLQFLRTNSFQKAVGTQYFIQVSQSTVCTTVNEVAEVINGILLRDQVFFPDITESKHISETFFHQSGIPGIIGVIDGTHIAISKPTCKVPPPERFYNRKGYYSINVVMCADHLGRIRHFDSTHAGSAHDSRIFNEGNLKSFLESRFSPAEPQFIIGDEGFGCSDVLLTIVRVEQLSKLCQGMQEKTNRFNKALRNCRVVVEHTFGMLKKRFPALLYQLRCNKMKNVMNIIRSAVILHNILINYREEIHPTGSSEEDFQQALQRQDMEEKVRLMPQSQHQYRVRNKIIQNFF